MRLETSGKRLHVGRWKILLSLFPIKVSVDEDELLDDEPPDDEEDPDPPLTVPPLGVVSVTPFVENTTLPF